MRKFTKLLLVMMCMILTLSLGMSIKAEAANVTSGTLGDNGGISWTYDADTKTLTITGEDTGGFGININGYSKFYNICEEVETIIVKDCKMYDCSSLFAGLRNVQSITFENFDTSEVTSMSMMFYRCESLTKLDLRGIDTGEVLIMANMFAQCTELTELDLSGFDTRRVANMMGMFKNCSAITKLNLSGLETGNVLYMDSMFLGCSALENINLSGFDTHKVTNMEEMFFGCEALTELDLSAFETKNVTNMSEMFYQCYKLNKLVIDNFNTGKVTTMAYMFYSCSNLTELNLDGFNTNQVTAMQYMFAGCSGLKKLDLSKFNTSQVTNMNGMFQSCVGLTELDLRGLDTSQVTSMSWMFDNCKGLLKLDLSGFNTENVLTMKAMFYRCEALKTLDLSNFNTSQVTNMQSMFRDCETLTFLDVSKFDTRNVTTMTSMFMRCFALTSLDVSNFVTSQVTDMGEMFYGCSGLTVIDVSGFDTSKVSSMSSMFSSCYALTLLDVSKFDTSNVKYMGGMFYNCYSLKSLDVSGFNTENVTEINAMFYGCSKITELDVSGFDTKNVTKMSSMFKGCTGITELDVSGFDTGNVTDMSSMFWECENLKNLDVSNFDTSKVKNVEMMFRSCYGLISLDLSSFDLSNVTKTNQMLLGCKGVSQIYTPKAMSVELSIDLPDIYLDTNNNQVNIITKGLCNTLLVKAKKPVQSIKLTKSQKGNLWVGETDMVSASITPYDAYNKAVTWSSSDTSIITVDANGNVKGISPGTADIIVTAQDGSGVSGSLSIKVVQPVTEIILDKTTLEIKPNETYKFNISISPENASDKGVTIYSSNPDVVYAYALIGKVLAKSEGTATITAKANDGSGVIATCVVTVRTPVDKITLSQKSMNIPVGESKILTADISPSNATNQEVIWTSSDTSVATVDASGNITGVSLGTATITVTAKDKSGVSASCKVSVYRAVDKITLNKSELKIKVNETYDLTATVSPSNATDPSYTWKSSDTSVAKVDENGKVTALKGGTATITATANDGSGVSASCDVTVIQPVTYLSIVSSKTMKLDESCTLTVSINTYATNKEVYWSSSDSSVVTVDANGKLTAVGLGSAVITVTAKDGSGMTDTCNVRVIIPVEEIVLDKMELQINKGSSYTLSSTIIPSNATNKTVVWYSQYPEIATVDENTGKVTAVELGTTEIAVFSKEDYAVYTICKVTITQPVTGISLEKNSLNLKTGDSTTLTATIAPSDAYNKAVAWKSSNTAVATVDTNGKVTAVGPGTATITVTAKDGSGKSASCTVTVKDENPFADVKKDSWMYPFVEFVYDHNIMAGKGKTAEGKIIFDPDNYMTRAEFVQTLYNKEGKPAVTYTDTFTDVPEGQWYTNAILWASQNGIAAGKGDKFDISGKITREEVATILYKYATNYKKYDTTGRASLDAYEDTESISSWAVNNMKWAIHYGIMKGRGNVLAPKDNASRAECATMLKNFMDAYK